MSERHEEIRRVVAELEDHLAKVEASMAVLKALVAEDDGEESGVETSVDPTRM